MSAEERSWRAQGLKRIVTARDPGDWVDDQLADIDVQARAASSRSGRRARRGLGSRALRRSVAGRKRPISLTGTRPDRTRRAAGARGAAGQAARAGRTSGWRGAGGRPGAMRRRPARAARRAPLPSPRLSRRRARPHALVGADGAALAPAAAVRPSDRRPAPALRRDRGGVPRRVAAPAVRRGSGPGCARRAPGPSRGPTTAPTASRPAASTAASRPTLPHRTRRRSPCAAAASPPSHAPLKAPAAGVSPPLAARPLLTCPARWQASTTSCC